MPDPVPYQAYKSKRHSHTRSNSNTTHISHVSPPSPTPGQFNTRISPSSPPRLRYTLLENGEEKDPVHIPPFLNVKATDTTPPPPQPVIILEPEDKPIIPGPFLARHTSTDSSDAAEERDLTQLGTVVSSSTPAVMISALSAQASSSSSMLSSSPHQDSPVLSPQPPRKTSTFRRVPLRNPRPSLSSSSLGPSHGGPSHFRVSSLASFDGKQLDTNSGSPSRQSTNPRSRHLSVSSTISSPPSHPATVPASESPNVEQYTSIDAVVGSVAQTTVPSSSVAPSISTESSNNKSPATSDTQRKRAPYHPGFQPRGVVRSQTENFLALRQVKQEGERVEGVKSGMKQIERTKLERRLEKLINLHFPTQDKKETKPERMRPGVGVVGQGNNRRASSFLDFDIRNMAIPDAGGLLRGVLGAGEVNGDIRAAEQRITPWQDDASVTKCSLCTATFHPLTTRKHHCRLCGRIICSLPPKRPQRLNTCSLLFVVDRQTRMIEEVGERVDYGVKRRKGGDTGGGGPPTESKVVAEEEKFLKGVRICRSCRPVLLRQQHLQEIAHVPTFTKLYDMLLRLEVEIEESLPQFQELILTLSQEDRPIKDASSTRKRLLQAFAQYDELAKRIRRLPSPNGPGSSHDRVQMAVMARASLFLQKNMFPLQSLPTSKRDTTTGISNASIDGTNPSHFIDPESHLALALQPLLEQEALLETFVEEAEARRKFEDVKTLKANLGEIRAEIQKIVNGQNDA